MTTITLRSSKGSPLTIAEVDNNFSNLNSFKLEITGSTGSATLPVGTTAQRDSVPGAGYLRYNSSTVQAELYNGTSWTTVGGATLSDDTTTNATYYPSLATASSGTATTLRVSTTKLSFNPSTGTLAATGFSGNGASLTSLNASNISTGAVAAARLGGGTPSTSTWLRGDSNWVSITASDISSGTIATARLGSGTANSTTWLRGDQTWATINQAPSLSNDTTTNASYYPVWSTSTSGVPTNIYVSTTKLYFNPSTGTLNATIFNSLSDVTLKTNIKRIENATATINKIDGVEFDWKDNGKKSAGTIAQQLEQILPHLVDTSEDGTKTVNYSGLIAYLIESNKELHHRIEALESANRNA